MNASEKVRFDYLDAYSVTFMARENLVLHGLNYHKVIKSLHRFQSMEHPLPGLPVTQDDV
ncbi:hypothetical protein HID58_005581 [Brassica napus]|uniref:Uncharacterized protein n=1 Tax=Brassica napus TaxID=3708 RepID=A0ABQ8E902_BRANA|nr:hypothetical protein HID58_005581 [Brassica napus]